MKVIALFEDGQVSVPRFIFSKLHKNAPISTEKGQAV